MIAQRLKPNLKRPTRVATTNHKVNVRVSYQVISFVVTVTLLLLIRILKVPLLESSHFAVIDYRVQTILAMFVVLEFAFWVLLFAGVWQFGSLILSFGVRRGKLG